MIVGDGTPAFVFTSESVASPYIQLFKWDGERYVGPKILFFYRSTFNNQHAYCHPRFTPDREASPAHSLCSWCYAKRSGGGGKAVLYTLDLTSYSNMYLVEVGEFEGLPDLS